MPEQVTEAIRSAAPAADAVPERGGLAALLAPELDPAFAVPPLLDVPSAWYGHIPFASWLVRTLQPELLVELGTHHGVSYAAFCQAVRDAGLFTRCFAVDSWTGDEHAGFYGPDVLDRFRAFHDPRFGGFSTLLPMRFDQALDGFGDGTVQLLHVDGRHGYEDVRNDYEHWLPKLAPGGIVLFHDTGVRERGFGVWRFWTELRDRHPAFEFTHCHGLGVLAPKGVPAPLEPLFAAAATGNRTLPERFAALGARWEAEHDRAVALATGDADRPGTATAARDDLRRLEHAHDRLRDELAWTKTDRFRLETALNQADAAAATARGENRVLVAELAAARDAGREAALRAAERVERAESARIAGETAATEAEREAEQRTQIALTAAGSAAAAREAELHVELAALRAALGNSEREVARLLGSRSWRVTRPLRALSVLGRGATATDPDAAPADPTPATTGNPTLPPVPAVATLPEPTAAMPPDPAPEPATAAAVVADVSAPASPEPDGTPASDPIPPGRWRPIRHVLFVSGEPDTPGAVYRVRRNAAACRAAGYGAEEADLLAVNPDNLGRADLLVIWRATWNDHVANMVAIAHRNGTRVCFDADDLIMQPAMASETLIDGIRTTATTEAESRGYFLNIRRTLEAADLCTVTTAELASQAGQAHPVVHVIPNSFDAPTETASRLAARGREERPADGRTRIGYAGGTRTHQKDFAVVADALARVLDARPGAILVLFRDGRTGEGLVLLQEFPALLPFADRIEWRDMVPLAALPAELARFDVSLCPLERDNPFCESKSELKYFESALAGCPLVATPTGPFRRAIRDRETGFLPETGADWERVLLELIDDPALRRRVARDARHDSLWRFGARRQAELWFAVIDGLNGGAVGARSTALSLARGAFAGFPVPEVPDGELLFSYDSLRPSRVTVGMTSYNYARHLPDTLASVSAQTLRDLDLVVVDDGSGDDSVRLLLDWADRERLRFNRVRILRTRANAGLGGARNLVFSEAETPHVMVLDSDNRLAPEACAVLLAALDAEPLAAFAYPTIRQFRDTDPLEPGPTTGALPFDPGRLRAGNYIDAMALVARWAWAAAGGYYVRRDAMGWEDFTLWCRLVELGQFGVWVPEELAFYRVHPHSMVNAITEQSDNKRRTVELAEARHPWLRLQMRGARQRC